MFDEKTIQHLKYYVYMLVDPVDNKPFYIGKGIGNRVFNHLDFALTDLDAKSAKYEIIRRINEEGSNVVHIIARHGLIEREAYLLESSLIDSFRHFGFELSNLVAGHNAIEKGLMTTDELCRTYNAQPLDNISEDCIIVNINKKYVRGSGVDAIYEASKGVWAIDKREVLNKDGSIKRKYVLSEYHGFIVEVFEVDEWRVQERGYNPKAKRYGQKRNGFAFEGTVAVDAIRNLYLNKSIAHHKKRGSSTAHRLML